MGLCSRLKSFRAYVGEPVKVDPARGHDNLNSTTSIASYTRCRASDEWRAFRDVALLYEIVVVHVRLRDAIPLGVTRSRRVLQSPELTLGCLALS